MTGFLYEKDLRMMKYHILQSPRHARAVRGIALMLGIREQDLRRLMIRQFDMSLLENLADRYETGLEVADHDDALARELGSELFTRFIPLLDTGGMSTVLEEVRRKISAGKNRDAAITEGISKVREQVFS